MLDWDRSHDWVLHRHWHDLTRVIVRFRRWPPTVAELAALRRCLPHFRDMPPTAVRATIPSSGVLELGIVPTPNARRWIEALQAEGVEVVAKSMSFVSYLPIDRTTGSAWLIDDTAKADAVVRAMLAEGVSVDNFEE
jgi:hypothetical protein